MLQKYKKIKNSQEERTRYIGELKTSWREAFCRVEKEYAGGQRSGLDIVNYFVDLSDSLVRDLYAKSLSAVPAEGHLPEKYESISIVATGGYGRRELLPHSDIDLLFLVESEKEKKKYEAIVQYILYCLWDMGFNVGHSYQSIAGCIDSSKEDITVFTSLLESRIILGSDGVYRAFLGAFFKNLKSGQNLQRFIDDKILEKKLRYSRYSGSATLLEPDIKESPGGLRDYNHALWVLKASFGEDFAERGILMECEEKEYNLAVDRLLQVRSELHFLKNKGENIITVESWPCLAKRFGKSEVRAFMRDYYLNTRAIQYYSDLITQKCLEKCKKKSGSHIRPGKKNGDNRPPLEAGACLQTSSQSANNTLCEVILFLKELLKTKPACPEQKETSAPWGVKDEMKRRVRLSLKLNSNGISGNEEIIGLFLSVFKCKNGSQIITEIHQAGLLKYIIPEFKYADCLSQFDPFHQYTVDEHSIRALKNLELLSDTQERGLKLFSEVYKELEDNRALKLAVLFHDIGKGKTGDHSKIGCEMAGGIAKRLRLSAKEESDLKFLVRHHILMSRTAQRHDIEDRAIVINFADIVKNVERLKMLFLLTYSDIRAVGQGSWSEWKGSLLSELFKSSCFHIERQYEVLEQKKSAITEFLTGKLDKNEIIYSLEQYSKESLSSLSVEKLSREIYAAIELKNTKSEVLLVHSINDSIACSEFIVCTKEDHPGLFSDIAGIILSYNLSIMKASLSIRSDGIVLDTLYVLTEDNGPIRDVRLIEALQSTFRQVWNREVLTKDLISKNKRFISPKKSRGARATKVKVDNETSNKYTALHVTTPDRQGVLYALSSAIFHMGVDINMAKIATEGDRVIDTFYLSINGGKINDKNMLESICLFLKNAVEMSKFL